MSLDSKSLYHEAKATGIVYQATLRHELHTELGVEWAPVNPLTGMAEVAAVTRNCIKAWSQRSTRLREWAHNNLAVVDGQPTASSWPPRTKPPGRPNRNPLARRCARSTT